MKIKSRLGIVVGSYFEALTYFCSDTRRHLLVEIKGEILAVFLRKLRILYLLVQDPQAQTDGPLCIDFYGVSSKNGFEQRGVYVVCGQEVFLGFLTALFVGIEGTYFLFVIVADVLFETVVFVFFRRHKKRCFDDGVSKFFANHIPVDFFFENHLFGQGQIQKQTAFLVDFELIRQARKRVVFFIGLCLCQQTHL